MVTAINCKCTLIAVTMKLYCIAMRLYFKKHVMWSVIIAELEFALAAYIQLILLNR